ncbi:hypothetical protein GDO86_008887 [Hymenochirus boettgeri]|uniref:Uncharacterized protein n=1 Tax=Hymenochirus boettgeri TaxID=247094 RepID=A0A8T2J3J8_9PIPI|nr:hypothetical protein GDO86_008887 [Hymenochirus boettgeri]
MLWENAFVAVKNYGSSHFRKDEERAVWTGVGHYCLGKVHRWISGRFRPDRLYPPCIVTGPLKATERLHVSALILNGLYSI